MNEALQSKNLEVVFTWGNSLLGRSGFWLCFNWCWFPHILKHCPYPKDEEGMDGLFLSGLIIISMGMVKQYLPINPCKIHEETDKTINVFSPLLIPVVKILLTWARRSPLVSSSETRGHLWPFIEKEAFVSSVLLPDREGIPPLEWGSGQARQVVQLWIWSNIVKIWSNSASCLISWQILTWENKRPSASQEKHLDSGM